MTWENHTKDRCKSPSEKAKKILSLKEATKRELQESKTAEIESVAPRGNRPDLVTDQNRSKGTRETLRGSLSKQVAVTVAIATADMHLEVGAAQRRKHDAASAIKWDISLSYARVYL